MLNYLSRILSASTTVFKISLVSKVSLLLGDIKVEGIVYYAIPINIIYTRMGVCAHTCTHRDG